VLLDNPTGGIIGVVEVVVGVIVLTQRKKQRSEGWA
jgi:hypothetical protein